ncbi:phosphate ABC transporter substrate-binding protein [Rheinheimera sp.]|uniref:phosphate ABC transporter substrate-binding protein n=1 Tax=Rheinheimera sp. TaxID=1869214 RepID=UPI00307F3821
MKSVIYAVSLFCCSAVFADIAIIAHPSNTASLDADTVARIYLGRDKNFPGGAAAVPVALQETNAATNTFNEQVLKKSSSQLKSYWSKLVFTGKGTPPKELASDEEMIQLVAGNPNLIGYVDASKVDASVKVLLKL